MFGSEVKLIKATSCGDYQWNDTLNSNIWNSSSIKNTLNITFLNLLNEIWQNKIVVHTWYVGGYTTSAVTPKEFYIAENTGTTDSMKIGLMYVSDYGFAASNNYWTTNMNVYGTTTNTNWLLSSKIELTICRNSSTNDSIWHIANNGRVLYFVSNGATTFYAIRPTFYLASSITYVSGSGTSSDPIRLIN